MGVREGKRADDDNEEDDGKERKKEKEMKGFDIERERGKR